MKGVMGDLMGYSLRQAQSLLPPVGGHKGTSQAAQESSDYLSPVLNGYKAVFPGTM